VNTARTNRGSFLGMCVAELRKVRGRGLLYAALLFGACHGLLAAAAVKGMEVVGNKFTEDQMGGETPDPIDFTVVTDLAVYLAVFPVNGFVLLFLFSIIWAEDFSLGTMAMIFSRPVTRWRIFAAKATVSLGVGAASLGLAAATALILGLILFGVESDVTLLEGAPVVGWMAEVPGSAARLLHIANGWLLGTVLLAPAVAITALMGSLSRSPVLTLVSSMLLLFGDFFVKSVLAIWGSTGFDGHESALQFSKWTIWASRDLFDIHGPWSSAWSTTAVAPAAAALAEATAAVPQTAWGLLGQPLSVTLLYTVVLGGLALLVFCKRDVT
jgi:ABC-type transport system involved in multi-copper enzyme maturation permease subunit